MIPFEPPTELLDRPVRITLENGVAYEGTYLGVRFDEVRLDRDARSIRGDLVTPCPRGVMLPRNRAGRALVSIEAL